MTWYKHLLLPLVALVFCAMLLIDKSLLLEPLEMLWLPHLAQYSEKWLLALFYLSATWLIVCYVQYALLSRVPKLIADIIRFLLFGFGLLFILNNVFDQDITALLATGGVSVLVLGVALKDIIASVFAGMIVSLEQPFSVGDTVELLVLGKPLTAEVVEVNWRATRLQTRDGRMIVVPNNVVSGSTLVNYSKPDTKTRFSVEIRLDYDTSAQSAERILLAAALDTKGVLANPKPYVRIAALDQDGITYEVYFWNDKLWDKTHVKDTLYKSILRHLHWASIRISSPKNEIVLTRQRSGVADRTLDRIQLLNQLPLMRIFSAQQCREIAADMQEHLFNAGQDIIRMGDTTPCLWIVGEGRVKTIRDSFAATPPQISYFVATEFFGADALLVGASFTMSVSAETDAVLYTVCQKQISQILQQDKNLLAPLAHALATQTHLNATAAEHEQYSKRFKAQIMAFYQLSGSG